MISPARGGPDTAGVDPAEIVRQRALGWPDFHPEDYCHRCGRPNPCWFADTAEWQTATSSTGDGGGILCPSCFCALWEQVTGRAVIIWRLSIDPRSRDARPVPTPAACCGSDQPAACPDDCAARREREQLREQIARELDRHAPNLGPRQPNHPHLWFSWCSCGWDGGQYSEGYDHPYRLHVADDLLALPALAAVLGRLATAEAKVQRVEALAERAQRHGYDLDPDDVLDAIRAAIAAPVAQAGEGR